MSLKRRHVRRVPSLALSALLVFSLLLAGCSASMYDAGSPSSGGSSTDELSDRVASGLSIRAQRGSKTLDIQRTSPMGKRPSGIEKDTWTVFVYLCGSDLETQGGSATRDLAEMVGARGSENVSFVVETGGAKQWRGNVGGSNTKRYLVQDGSIMEVDRGKAADMGDPKTLASFLSWGLKNYPADRMGVILWDHGAGSISGVCFDERNSYDSLLLRELDMAFAQVNPTLWQKFDFVGFDACLMGTLETANVLAPYADYMIASQESEPSTGWEYSSIIEYLAKHPACSVEELGRELCDTYMESLPANVASTATLAVTDLSRVDDLIQDFYSFSQEMYESGSDQGTLAAMTRGIKQAENYGNNNWLEGYSNMVDLGGIVKACASVTPSADDVRASLNDAVTYQVRGRGHAGSSGLSIYYPLSVNNSRELTAFQTVALNPSYLSYVDRVAHGATYGGTPQYTQYTTYSNDSWYSSDDIWSLLLDEYTISLMQSMRSVDPRWEYVDEHEATSEVVSFAEEPQVDDKGVYWFQLDADGIDNVASTSGFVYGQSDGGGTLTLGETFDVYADWETGIVEDGFDGKWLSLPDGQNLCLYVAEYTEDQVTYTSPILLNGDSCYLRVTQDLESGEVQVEGVWHGEGENGLVDRSGTQLVEGDKVVPLYSTGSEVGTSAEVAFDVEGDEYTVPADGLTIDYAELPAGTYFYSFNITDVFGDRLVTDKVQLDIEEDGIYFVG